MWWIAHILTVIDAKKRAVNKHISICAVFFSYSLDFVHTLISIIFSIRRVSSKKIMFFLQNESEVFHFKSAKWEKVMTAFSSFSECVSTYKNFIEFMLMQFLLSAFKNGSRQEKKGRWNLMKIYKHEKKMEIHWWPIEWNFFYNSFHFFRSDI